ncbi:50S ribosomal protein L11 methyltransferase [Terrihabitans rhizophilus]|uniref:Ribosomal protein L11 methyltransferase n=1 Tax=Terrihabitans rhizophilus TaxID=3092662 RepID=A0ABU4RL68_9HYPH|nr:50S ribosomal protein L11 methyltransferase [Terrihabitans sp. PJ23]MDX6805579.1 50S ribosomal protein L11 methyltransferase [Terrihabitans sp. PJ23]
MPTAVLRIFAPQQRAEHIALLAEEMLTLDDLSIVVSETEPDDPMWRVDLFAGVNIAPSDLEAEVRAVLADEIDGCETRAEAIEDADWVAQSLAGLDPVLAGRFFVHGAHDRDHVPANAVGIQVEAALAFGTGHHGTTRGCLLAFDRLLKRTRPQRVLDLGTGTGVLGIAAAKALHIPVLASDIDAMSVVIARENAALNRAGQAVRVLHANGMQDRHIQTAAPYDLVFANILAGPLVALAPSIARAVMPGGVVILSGLLTHQERAVRAAYRAQGLIPVGRIVLNNWVTMTLAA